MLLYINNKYEYVEQSLDNKHTYISYYHTQILHKNVNF